jgi:hypothetical protein
MATEIYLGYPPENIKKWIKAEAERKYQEMLKTPLTFTAEEPNAKISFNKGTEDNQIVISTDKQNWSNYKYGTEITLTNVGDKVYFRAADDIENWTFNGYQFYTYGKIAASGNLNTLLKADGSVLDFSTLKNGKNRSYCYYRLFFECYLTQAPELPATTLAEYCYNYMFSYCSSLTQAPELPATTLVNGCYDGMFCGCTSLTKAPELPATTLAKGCYNSMFSYCSSLTQAPELPATTLVNGCYDGMFAFCSFLTQAPELPATTLAKGCYNSMFSYCTSLTKAPELPATTLAEYCYSYMFSGCSSLTQASFPNLEKEMVATEVVESQYTFSMAAPDIETTCKDGTLIINSTDV